MARSVDDLMLALRVMVGPDYRDAFSFPTRPLGDHRQIDLRSLRIAFWTGDDFLHPTNAVQEVFDAAIDKLRNRVAQLTQVDPPFDLKEARQIMVAFVHPDAVKWNLAGIKEAGDQGAFFARWTQRIADLLEEIPQAERGALASQFPRLRSSVLKSMEGYDAILTPSFSCPALPHGGTADGETDGVRSICYPLFMRFVWTFPIGTIRCGTAEGLPVGLQVTGDRYQEEKTLAIMRAVESDLGGYQRPPDL
jgi:amidase